MECFFISKSLNVEKEKEKTKINAKFCQTDKKKCFEANLILEWKEYKLYPNHQTNMFLAQKSVRAKYIMRYVMFTDIIIICIIYLCWLVCASKWG